MIYCVEDDLSIQGMMVYTLKASGFEAKGINDGPALYKALSEELPQLILLDLNLPIEDGISILTKLKQNESYLDIPVIIATARGTEYDKVIGLDKGADDYLSKPFGMMEMISRVKAVLRRCNKNKNPHLFHVKDLTLDESKKTIFIKESPIRLTIKEYELLSLLVKNKNKLFSREELFKTIWGQANVEETRTVDVHIGTIRTKISKSLCSIVTVRGAGYRLVEADESR